MPRYDDPERLLQRRSAHTQCDASDMMARLISLPPFARPGHTNAHAAGALASAAMLGTVGAQHSREYFDIYVHFLSEERLYFGPISYRSLCAFFAKEKQASMAVARPRPLSLRPLTGQRARMC